VNLRRWVTVITGHHALLVHDEPREAALQSCWAAQGARAERVADGTTKSPFAARGTPLDQATQAARLRPAPEGRPARRQPGISTSRADLAGKLSLGDVIDRAGHLLATTPVGTIHIDGLTAHLLGNPLRNPGASPRAPRACCLKRDFAKPRAP